MSRLRIKNNFVAQIFFPSYSPRPVANVGSSQLKKKVSIIVKPRQNNVYSVDD